MEWSHKAMRPFTQGRLRNRVSIIVYSNYYYYRL
nr:MAG TPA: hypothetical protein [Caudoviricetes sp.]